MCPVDPESGVTPPPAWNDLAIQIVHDNYACLDSLQTAWGFSALVTGLDKTILFDTGSDGTLLLENLARLQIDPGRIERVVLSHIHGDHTGGLTGLLRANPRVQVYLPAVFPARFKEVVRGHGATVVEIRGPQEIGGNVYTTGVLGRRVKEQSLVLRTPQGLIVLTGCAHPGIANILKEVRRLHEDRILLVLGGFHLEWVTRWRIAALIRAFRSCGIRYVAPTHCSGEKTRRLFQEAYGPAYLEAGVGRRITLAELTG